ncbi:SDR family oxidoreductase [Chitinophaga sp.]|uniref:SDR family oxidoreductase n=1 Tax=Chitinophaga sp. TaxID=1869181 RepID=UPI0031E0D3CC
MAVPEYMQQLPAGRVGYPEDIANAALFPATSYSAYMHGASLVIDGGMTSQ